MGTWEELDHTADIAVRVCADSLEDLFLTSVDAMFSLVAKPKDADPTVSEFLELDAMDREALLIDWLNELLYIHERDGVVITDIVFEYLTDTELQVRVRGVPVKAYYANIKAATFHNLSIEAGEDGFRTVIVFDV